LLCNGGSSARWCLCARCLNLVSTIDETNSQFLPLFRYCVYQDFKFRHRYHRSSLPLTTIEGPAYCASDNACFSSASSGDKTRSATIFAGHPRLATESAEFACRLPAPIIEGRAHPLKVSSTRPSGQRLERSYRRRCTVICCRSSQKSQTLRNACCLRLVDQRQVHSSVSYAAESAADGALRGAPDRNASNIWTASV